MAAATVVEAVAAVVAVAAEVAIRGHRQAWKRGGLRDQVEA